MSEIAKPLWVKVCGMTDQESIEAAVDAGADAVGFVFAPSVRRVSVARANELARSARGRAACVAVTLHPTASEVAEILRDFAPDILQADFQHLAGVSLPAMVAPLPVLRVGSIRPAVLPQRALFEGPRSGTGEIADWSAAATLARQVQIVLAGGLHCDNLAAAIAMVAPYGVDVSSGVEVTPGRKSPELIWSFVKTARAVASGES